MDARKNGRKQFSEAFGAGATSSLACLLLARAFFLAPIYVLSSATQASRLYVFLPTNPKEITWRQVQLFSLTNFCVFSCLDVLFSIL